MRVAVVGHVEHIEFLRVGHFPKPGEILHAKGTWEEAAGGGGVAAVQLAKLAGSSTLFTALGDDARGHAIPLQLAQHGVRVMNAWRGEPQRRGVTLVDDRAERTIIIIGARHQPDASDALPWDELADVDAVYFTAGSPEVLQLARRAKVVVATSRVLPVIASAYANGVILDAIVRSANDPGEPDPGTQNVSARLLVATEGAKGGSYVERLADGTSREGRWQAASLPGPAIDAYGCGDSFAAGLTFALGAGLAVDDALAFAAKCGAACMTGRGPYPGQIVLSSGDPLRARGKIPYGSAR